jgi:hypothetical protein
MGGAPAPTRPASQPESPESSDIVPAPSKTWCSPEQFTRSDLDLDDDVDLADFAILQQHLADR